MTDKISVIKTFDGGVQFNRRDSISLEGFVALDEAIILQVIDGSPQVLVHQRTVTDPLGTGDEIVNPTIYPLYGPNAPWNIPVAGIATDADTVELVRVHYDHSSVEAGHFQINAAYHNNSWTEPFYDAGQATAFYPITTVEPTWGNLDGTRGDFYGTVPWNASWQVPPDTDAGVHIVDFETGQEWNIFRADKTFDGVTHNMWSGSVVQNVEFPEETRNDDASIYTKENPWRSTGAFGQPGLAAMVNAVELRDGVIKHALQTNGINNADGDIFRLPVNKRTKTTNPTGTGNDRVPLGTRFALDVTDGEIETHLASLPADVPSGIIDGLRIVAVALRDYGWFVAEHGGGNVRFKFEHHYSGSAIYEEIGFDGITSSIDGKKYPREGITDLISKTNMYALVTSDLY